MSRFVAIELDRLPPPDAVQVPDFEALLALRKADIMARVRARTDDAELLADLEAVLYRSELEPLVVDQEVSAEREVIVHERINDAVRAVLLPTSQGADLDNICSRLGVERMRLAADPAASPPTAEIVEDDARLKRRYQLALEAFSTCGPYGAYLFHAMTASLDVLDCGVYGPEEDFVDLGHVHLYVLSRTGDGAAPPALVAAVLDACSADDRRPLADFVHAYPATIADYVIAAHLVIRRGADASLVVDEARRELESYAAETHRVGSIVALSGLYDAAHSPNTIKVTISSPAAEIDPGPQGAPYCTGITITHEVIDG
ncbi:MAG: baseplate J/gp47 family protein [Hyphomicrobiaceae bacterium]|nr:baseplate J/gp47 family protein [Hyphomicrobiaceae bacterium]